MTTKTYAEWRALAEKLKPVGQIFIDGKYRDARNGETLANINPADGKPLGEIARGREQDIDDAVKNARQAWRDGRWRNLPPVARGAVLQRLAVLVETHAEELALLECLDMGKPISDVLNIDLPEVARTLRYFGECADKIEGVVTHTAPQSRHFITHEPMGVIGAITPWNYPLLMAVWKLAPALVGGNCVVLKPSEIASLTCVRLASLFIEAGGPSGVFNVVTGLGAEAGAALALHPEVAKLTFTGSTAVGKLLLGYAGQSNMKRIALETGGKSPQIFMPDLYDMESAVDRAIGGIYDNAGQVCNAGSRLLVHRAIYDRFLETFIHRAPQLYSPGAPLDPATTLGCLASFGQRDSVVKRIDQALADGAKLILGQGRADQERSEGAFLSPCLFVGVKQTSRIVQEEVFGPVATLQVFDTEEEALALANDSDFGLAASVWTSDLKTAHRMTAALEAGVVWVNCFGDGDLTQPFGGYKQSGNSHDKHQMSILSYMETKSTWFAF